MVDRGGAAITPDSEAPAVRIRTSVLAGALVLAFAASPAVLAAPGVTSGCETVARALKSSEITVESLASDLAIDIVDHMPENQGAADPVIGHAHDPTAPLLFLTPRVAHILQDVFGDDANNDANPAKPAGLSPMERVRQVMVTASAAARALPQSASPAAVGRVGGDDTGSPTVSSDGTHDLYDGFTQGFLDVDTLPRFQRRMYRNDI